MFKLFKKVIIVVIVLFSFMSNTILLISAAEESDVGFLTSDVLEDLKSSEGFDISDYPFDVSAAHPELINFVEFGYAYDSEAMDYFGLYVYIYNPQDLDIDTDSNLNKIQLADSYNSEGLPDDYSKFNLVFVNASQGDYEDLFYKFRIDGSENLLEDLNSSSRRYDVSGFELLSVGNNNATEYAVGGTYIFTGYSEGFGQDPEAESTLSCTVNDLETVSLDVHSTYYRTGVSSLGVGHQNQLNTVYFAVPNSLLENYGKLQRIKAEWNEYKTTPIIVTSSSSLSSALNPYIGQNIGTHTDELQYTLGINYDCQSAGGSTLVSYDWSYNVELSSSTMGGITSDDVSELLSILFYTGGASVGDYTVSAEDLEAYMYANSELYYQGLLFDDQVDSGRTRGYNVAEIDSDDTFDMLSYDSNHTWLDRLLDFGFWAPETGGDLEGVSPIYAVSISDLLDSNSDLSNNLLIAESDVPAFREYCTSEIPEGKTVFLFRFAQTDYYSNDVTVFDYSDGSGFVAYEDLAYMAYQTIFLNFDVIQLTFNAEGIYHVIPAVSNPINVIPDITPPLDDIIPSWRDLFNDGLSWLQTILMIVALVVLLIILWLMLPILKPIISGLVWLIFWPFKMIGKGIKAIKKSKGKKYDRRYYKQ